MLEKREPQMGNGDPKAERYFNSETGLVLDKNVLIGIMYQFRKLKRGLIWEKLKPNQKGSLYRLAVYSGEARRSGLLSEEEADFLADIRVRAPKAGTEERKLFERALVETELVKGGLPLEAEDLNSQE